MRRIILAAALTLTGIVAAAPPPAVAQTAQQPIREITKLAGEVYRFRNNFHYSVFAVTPDGVIATDPIDADAAKWLKEEIAKSFGKPIKYLIYSHDHRDHISGGQVLGEGAVVISHANAKLAIVGEKRPTAVPQVTFTDRLEIELGGTTVELSYIGRNHSNNSIVMRFPKDRLLFAVDFIPVKSVAFRDFPDGYLEDWIESLKRVEAMDFDVLVPGHGPLGGKADVVAYRLFKETLRDEVLKLVREGKTLEEVKAAVKLPQYAGLAGYEQMFPLNVEGMYRMVQANRRGN